MTQILVQSAASVPEPDLNAMANLPPLSGVEVVQPFYWPEEVPREAERRVAVVSTARLRKLASEELKRRKVT
jgi:hypothetical protein